MTLLSLHSWFLVLAISAAAGTANAQIAPRVVVQAGETHVYRDIRGDVACRTDHQSTTCISRSLEALSCDLSGCELSTASEPDWTALRLAAVDRPVQPHTEFWSSTYGISGCTAQEEGGFTCQSSEANRQGIPEVNRTRVEGEAWARHLVGEWSSNCENGDAVSYFRNGTLEGDRRTGRWRIEGDMLTETYIVQAEPGDAGGTDMRFTRRSRLSLNEDGSLLKSGVWLSGGDVPADVVMVRCDGATPSPNRR